MWSNRGWLAEVAAALTVVTERIESHVILCVTIRETTLTMHQTK